MTNVATIREVKEINVVDTTMNHFLTILPHSKSRKYFGLKRSRPSWATMNRASKRKIGMEVGSWTGIILVYKSPSCKNEMIHSQHNLI